MHRFAPSPEGRALLALFAATTFLIASVAHAQEQKAPTPTAGKAEAVETLKVSPAAPASVEAPAPEAATPAPPEGKRPLSPMMTEIQAVFVAEAGKLAELRQRAARATTPDEALALQREIERVKFDTEVSLLRVQAKHARQAGRTEVASRIDAAISDLLNPPKVTAPAARPVPSRENPSR